MTADEVVKLTQHIDKLWPDSTASDANRIEFGKRAKPISLPYERACEIVGEVRWRAKWRSPEYAQIIDALSLESRRVAANVQRQEAGFAANRQPSEPAENIPAEHQAAREFVRGLSQTRLIELRDRVLSRRSPFVRSLVSDQTPVGIKPDESTAPLDWAKRETVLARLWVCMGLWMEHMGVNGWSPVEGGGERTKPHDAQARTALSL